MSVTVNVLSEARTLSTTSGRTLYVLDGMLGEDLDALIAACYSKSCAPPPVGTGGSDKGGRPPATLDVQTFLERTDAFNLEGVETNATFEPFQLSFIVDGEEITETAYYRSDAVLNTIAKQSGIDGLPTVLSTEEFNARKKDGGEWTVVYRGFGNGAAVTAFVEGEYSVGIGARGSGWYATTDPAEASTYSENTSGRKQVNGGRTVRMAIRPDARIVHYELSSSSRNESVSDLETFDRSLRSMDGFLLDTRHLREHPNLRAIASDAGRQAAVLGYDVIQVRKAGRMNYVILNREAVIVDGGTLS